MSEVVRHTITFPKDMYLDICRLRKEEKYMCCTYAEVVRRLLKIGLAVQQQEKQ